MDTREIRSVVLIGAGNLARHLGLALIDKGIKVLQVFNRSADRGESLASLLQAHYLTDFALIDENADCYILAVSDSAIGEVASRLNLGNKLIIHTSGSVDITILAHASACYGVLYPVQTFSGEQTVDFTKIPVCVEANNEACLNSLVGLAGKLSEVVYIIDSFQRRQLHLAAIFASNFSNFMYVMAEELLKENNLPSELIIPLIRQSGNVMLKNDFFSRQTGPARRGDQAVIAQHRGLLSEHPDHLEIYNLITNNILKYKSKNGQL